MNKPEKFARLLALSAIRTAQIKANPVPFLNEVADRSCRFERAIENAIMALSGADDFDMATDAFPSLSPGLVETALMRNEKAATLLRAALSHKRND